MRRRISRAEYEQVKATCAAHITLRMEQLNITPSEVQRQSTAAVLSGEQQAGVHMADLAAWRGCKQLPKDAKLKALAAVLRTSPDKLVPVELQSGRTFVARHINATLDDINGNYHIKVTPSEATPGHAYVEARILLPTAKAYDLAKALNRTNDIENMRRMGMDDEKIKETLAGAAKFAEVNR